MGSLDVFRRPRASRGALVGRRTLSMPIVEHEGASVAYVRDGRGPAVVLVHGTGGDGTSTYKGLDRRLREHWTVIRPDYSGSGVTKDDGRSLELEDLAGQVLAAATDVSTVVKQSKSRCPKGYW